MENTEFELELSVFFNKLGKVRITGCFQERQDLENKLIFDIGSDQTFIPPVIKQLTDVQKIFGGMKGVRLGI